MSAEPLTLEQLPDDALVAVMQHLRVDDLFACRLVCKRLCGLVLHWDVWCRRELDGFWLSEQRFEGILRRAPCMGTMFVRILPRVGRLSDVRSFATTTCSADRLFLKFFGRDAEISLLTLVVRNQEALGRLRTVVVNYTEHVDRAPFVGIGTGAIDVLLWTLVQSSSLERLEFPKEVPPTQLPVVHASKPLSLKKFRAELVSSSESLVTAVLAGHAATLEEVDVGVSIFRFWHDTRLRGLTSSPTTARLLVNLPRLRKLRCAAMPGLEDLVASETLADLTLLVYNADSHELVVSLVQRADQLCRLSLVNVTKGAVRKSIGEQAVKALASSERSRLESLSLFDDLPSTRPLVLALPRLPALRELAVCDESLNSELLRGISPVTAPALRRLELQWAYRDCAHAWLHSDAMGFLARNPLVHLQLQDPSTCDDGREQCPPCARRCHTKLVWAVARGHPWTRDDVARTFGASDSRSPLLRGLGLFTHDVGRCPAPQDHIRTQWKWIHVPLVSG